jgi:hypothetical protein
MDRVTEAFLSEFVTEHELSRLSPDKQFEHFAACVTVRRHYNGITAKRSIPKSTRAGW